MRGHFIPVQPYLPITNVEEPENQIGMPKFTAKNMGTRWNALVSS